MRNFINKAKLLVAAFTVLGLLIFTGALALAQTPTTTTETTAPASSLAFPIEELGGCDSENSCATYCEDPVHYNACSDFAKENGFYTDDQTQYGDDEFWQETQEQLGCSS